MRIPVVLPLARIRIERDGTLQVLLDGSPYADQTHLQRSDLTRLIDDMTADLQSPVRVEVTEADGTTYSDIATPPARDSTAPPRGAPAAHVSPGVSGVGFRPGEQVVVAYVLLHETADADGAAVVHLPPAAMTRRPGAMLLFGLASQVAALIEVRA